MENLTVNQLREAVDHLLNEPSFHKEAMKIGESFQKSGGYKQAVDEIFTFKTQFDIQ